VSYNGGSTRVSKLVFIMNLGLSGCFYSIYPHPHGIIL